MEKLEIKNLMDWKHAEFLFDLIAKQNNLTYHIYPGEMLSKNYFVALVDGKPSGVIKYEILNWYSCQIEHLSIVPEYKGKGIGKALVKFLLDKKIRPIYFATIYKDNFESIALFYVLGFEKALSITSKENLYMRKAK